MRSILNYNLSQERLYRPEKTVRKDRTADRIKPYAEKGRLFDPVIRDGSMLPPDLMNSFVRTENLSRHG